MASNRNLRLLVALLSLFTLFEGCNTQSQKADVQAATGVELKSLDDFDWLLGTWRRHNGADTSYETWQRTSGNAFAGTAWENIGSDTNIVERLKIISTDSGYYYVADVAHNQGPVYFRLATFENGKSVFENPVHDFPTRIIYWPIGDDSLYARIEGMREGKETGINFFFERLP